MRSFLPRLADAEHFSAVRFTFGRNWKQYLTDGVGEDQIASAMMALRRLLDVESFEGLTFLDVGSGSGLHSLAALRLGARRVTSFDVDPESVECTKTMVSRAGEATRPVDVRCGSVLDKTFMGGIPSADVVYAWGVLHHTGAMWEAVDAVAGKVEPGGLLCLGLYNWVGGRVRGTTAWTRIKRWYCTAPRWQRVGFEDVYVLWRILRILRGGRNPWRVIREYGRVEGGRGMSWRRDITDWLGGYPFEGATAGEVLDHVRRRFGYVLERQRVRGGVSSVNEYVFRRPRSLKASMPAPRDTLRT